MLKKLVRVFLTGLDNLRIWANDGTRASTTKPDTSGIQEPHITAVKTVRSVVSLWDFIKVQADTQADHLLKVIGFEEWIDMDEIRRRIREVLRIEYKNERSLYPYIKTLVDMGFLETVSVGGKRKWRKKDLLVEVEQVATKLSEIEKEATAPKMVIEVSTKRVPSENK